VGKQVDAAEERLETQVKGKRVEAEMAMEGLENEAEEKAAEVDGRAAYKLLAEVLGVNLNPSQAELKDFDYDQFKKQIPALAEAAVAGRVRAGLIGSIERRLGAQLDVPRDFKSDEDWADVREQLVAAAEKAHAAKADRSLGEIERELSQNLPPEPTRDDLTRALISMAFGTATHFDNKTHRKVALRTQRLNYFLAAGDLVADWGEADLKEDVIKHLGGALKALRRIWGEAEFRRLGGLKVAEMVPALRGALDADPEVAAALEPRPPLGPSVETLNDLSGPAREGAEVILGGAVVMQLMRQIMLQVIGSLWVEYLTSVEALRTAIGLEAYAQRDPLVAYKSKAFEMFQELSINIRSGVVARAFTYRPRLATEAPPRAPSGQAAIAPAGNGGGPAPAGPPPEAANMGRNEPCWCGSGKKYKDCHYAKDHAGDSANQAAQPGGQAVAAVASAPANADGGKRRRRKR
jgi:preprotein translocase subunit SecA